MSSASQPQHLSKALSELIIRRGLARTRGDAQLRDAWIEIAGQRIAQQTKVLGLRNGVLQVGVFNSAMLSELAAFHKVSLLRSLRECHSHFKVRELKFRLKRES